MRPKPLRSLFRGFIKWSLKNPRLRSHLRDLVRAESPATTLYVDYPVSQHPRYDRPHQRLYEILDRNREEYKIALNRLLAYQDDLVRIPRENSDPESSEPCWNNEYLTGLDAVALYGMIRGRQPRVYVEVGSGNSTLFARRAIQDQALKTRIISIDPRPRRSVEKSCDLAMRQPLEDADLDIFDTLEAGDIVFADNSHRVFMNSDVTTFFLDVLPRLRPGILVHLHDIFLPWDYPADWAGRYYSEQYLLAVLLLSESPTIRVILPLAFVKGDPELNRILDPLWSRPEMKEIDPVGQSFWFMVQAPETRSL